MQIIIERRTLTDGSHVFNVKLEGLMLQAVTEADAGNVAHKIRDAVEAHCVGEVARVVYRY